MAKRLKDDGHEQTEKILRELEKEISKEYKKAEDEVQKKLNDYLRRFKIKDDLKQKAVQNGLITQAEYKQWLVGQIMIGNRWEEMKATLAQDFSNAAQLARSTAFGHMPEVYAINHNYGTFQVEKASKVDTSYTLYDRQTVEELFMDKRGHFIPAPGKKLSKEIEMGKTVAWNKKNVQSCMLQGILQGESIPNMATRLAKSVGAQNRKASIRNVRTMTTGVENAGRMESYRRAEEKGIEMKKQWVSTLDDRTRHWHRELDGVAIPIDEPFVNDEGSIMYPGDTDADPANIFNCRCTLIASLKGFEHDWSDRTNATIGDMTYDEWKAKKESESNPITAQEEKSEEIKGGYIGEYKKIRESIPDEEDDDVDLDTDNGYYRVDKSVNPIEGYSEPMTKKHVKSIMKEMGVDYGKARVVIDKSTELVKTGFCGYTAPDGKTVTLYPDAFQSREQLVKTIGHEKIHLDQVRAKGEVVDTDDGRAREREAVASEEGWWNEYKRKNGL